MKKIFLLLVSSALVSASFAQYNDNSNDVAMNTTSKIVSSNEDYGYGANDTYVLTMKQKNLQTVSINCYYDEMIKSVKDMSLGSAYLKNIKINELEAQRLDNLHSLSIKFFDKKNVASYKKKYAQDIYYNNKYNWNL